MAFFQKGFPVKSLAIVREDDLDAFVFMMRYCMNIIFISQTE
jgi:hypothetical protein